MNQPYLLAILMACFICFECCIKGLLTLQEQSFTMEFFTVETYLNHQKSNEPDSDFQFDSVNVDLGFPQIQAHHKIATNR
jgi:hypothetical protein